MYRHALPFHNAGDRILDVIVEPWADLFHVVPGGSMEVILKHPEHVPRCQIHVSPGSVVVWAEKAGSLYEVGAEGRQVC